jgi:glycerol-3-phosphate dehydrogenase (NAD(P)+)
MSVAAVRVSVLGAGAWGTAFAICVAARQPGTPVLLWARDAHHVAAIESDRINARYLPGIALPPELRVTASLEEAAAHADGGLLVVATPTDALRAMLRELAHHRCAAPLLWLCKGLERGSARLAHEIVAEELPGHLAGPLSGPSFAQEVARGLPAALTVAGAAQLCQLVTSVLHGGGLRIYASDDVAGVEVGGAVKNVMAIATGIADALALGHNARAALITRGLSEITRLGVALGARPSTFMGLTGLGDLVLTCTGELSRNRQLGLMLGEGVALADALARLGHVAEGVWSAPGVCRRARDAGVDMPICDGVDAVLASRCGPREALAALLARDPRREDEPAG